MESKKKHIQSRVIKKSKKKPSKHSRTIKKSKKKPSKHNRTIKKSKKKPSKHSRTIKKSKKKPSKHNGKFRRNKLKVSKNSRKIRKSKPTPNKRRSYKFLESNYLTSFDSFPLIKQIEEEELGWRDKMFGGGANDKNLHEKYKLFLPYNRQSAAQPEFNYTYEEYLPNLKQIDNETYFGTILNNLYKRPVNGTNNRIVEKFDKDLDENSCTFISKNYQYSYGQNFKLVDEPIFKANLKTFTSSLFEDISPTKKFDWNCKGHGKVVIAGGSIMSCATFDEITNLTDGDIDLFLVDVKSGKDVLNYLLNWFEEKTGHNLIVRSKNAITYLRFTNDESISTSPLNRNIQIILRMYTSVQQLLCGFDVDSCCFAYDGSNLVLNQRSYRSVVCDINVVNPYTASKNGHNRLLKYMCRGFSMFLGINYKQVVETIFNYIDFTLSMHNLDTPTYSIYIRKPYKQHFHFTKTKMNFLNYFTKYVLLGFVYNKSKSGLVVSIDESQYNLNKDLNFRSYIPKIISESYFEENDYGLCPIGVTQLSSTINLYTKKETYEKLGYDQVDLKTDGLIRKPDITTLVSGTISEVINHETMPVDFIINGSGNHEAGSIRPLHPTYFSGNFIWNFGKLQANFYFHLFKTKSIFYLVDDLDNHCKGDASLIENTLYVAGQLKLIGNVIKLIVSGGDGIKNSDRIFTFYNINGTSPLNHLIRKIKTSDTNCSDILTKAYIKIINYMIKSMKEAGFLDRFIKTFINSKAYNDVIPLYNACRFGGRYANYNVDKFNLIKLLVENGANIDFYRFSALNSSFQNNQGIYYRFITPVSRLINCISTTNLENNKVICDILDYFSQRGFDFNRLFERRSSYARNILIKSNYIYDCISGYPLRDTQKSILISIQEAKLTILKKLIELGCDVKNNQISFSYCIDYNLLHIAKFLIKNGLDVSKVNQLGSLINSIILNLNTLEDHPEYNFQRMLIKQGMEIFDLILANGCNVNETFSSFDDRLGWVQLTPLEFLIKQK